MWSLSLCLCAIFFSFSLSYFFLAFGALLLKNNLYVSWKFWIFHFIMYITLLRTPFTYLFFAIRLNNSIPKAKTNSKRSSSSSSDVQNAGKHLMICRCVLLIVSNLLKRVHNAYIRRYYILNSHMHTHARTSRASHKIFHMNHHRHLFLCILYKFTPPFCNTKV